MSHSRVCYIKKVGNFDGYGFNLHAEKGKPGQYIGKVDEGSPAERAGLKQGDRILEVNGETIHNKTHKQVVELIKAKAEETTLLVVDPQQENGNGNGNGTGNGAANADADGTTHDSHEHANTNHNSNNHNDKQKEQLENGTLNLSMTAAELRARLAAKKKFDPKKEAMDFKQKFDIVQKL